MNKLGVISLLILLAACASPKAKPDPWGAVDASHMAYLLQDSSAGSNPRAGSADPVGESFVNLFAGLTTKPGGLTIGANYEYRYRHKFGFGGIVDYTFGRRDTVVLAGSVFFHPISDPLVLVVAPGVQFDDGNGSALLRLGGWYELPQDKYTLAPALYIDFVDGKSVELVAGVNFGFKLD